MDDQPASGPMMSQEEGYPPGPRPSDWETPDAIIYALYDVISVAAGEAVDWERDRALFLPDVRRVRIATSPEGEVEVRNMAREDFIGLAGPVLEQGFVELEIGRTHERYGNIVQAFSAYEGRRTGDGPAITRGINSIQLVWDGERWWVASIVWDQETADNPIPDRYLGR